VDIHDAIINKNQQIYQKGMAEQKILSLEDSIFLDQHNVLFYFDIKTGGSFIQHSSLEIVQQIQLVSLLSSMVDLYTKQQIDDMVI
jgi:hypothetical protein